MSGAYMRIQRDGKWTKLEVERMTPEERMNAFKGCTNEELIRWIDILCGTVVQAEEWVASNRPTFPCP